MIHRHRHKLIHKGEREILIALVGNANVGKSVIFNQLTGSNQIIGNWPGKTVELAFGKLRYKNRDIIVVDLPGIYSLSTYTQEEEVTRKFIATEKPDIVVNVVDASVIERNLYFTIQLIEMNVPLILCLNQIDIAEKKGIKINKERLEEILGIPIVETVAIKGKGLKELMDKVINYSQKNIEPKITYSLEVEERIRILTDRVKKSSLELPYPPRFVAIKLLEGDDEIFNETLSRAPKVAELAKKIARELEDIYGEPAYAVIASHRYAIISKILRESIEVKQPKKKATNYLDLITTHKVLGFITSIGLITLLLLWTFYVGDYLSTLLENLISLIIPIQPRLEGDPMTIFINGALSGIIAGLTLVIPYVIPFYLFLAVMEDSGIMTRIAFMLDTLMHRIGLHGKAIISIILGYGCAVPGIFSTRILESKRERVLASLAITMVPCSARTIVILGLVAAYIGVEWALSIYLINIIIVFAIDLIISKLYPGETPGLIMEIHEFRMPSLKVVIRQTLNRTLSIVYLVFPIYIIGSGSIQILYKFGILQPLDQIFSPLVSGLLGLPTYATTLFIFGFIRKELILLLLPQITGTFNIITILTPTQIFLLALVSTIYIPCISTVATLVKEFGWRDTILITITNIAAAILVGIIVNYILNTIFLI